MLCELCRYHVFGGFKPGAACAVGPSHGQAVLEVHGWHIAACASGFSSWLSGSLHEPSARLYHVFMSLP